MRDEQKKVVYTFKYMSFSWIIIDGEMLKEGGSRNVENQLCAESVRRLRKRYHSYRAKCVMHFNFQDDIFNVICLYVFLDFDKSVWITFPGLVRESMILKPKS